MLIAPSWTGAEQWVCVSDKIIGFRLQNEGWKETTFKQPNKWLLKQEIDGSKGFKIKQFEEENSRTAICRGTNEIVWCTGLWGAFKMNVINLRYISTATNGYVYDFEEQPPDPSIEIGTCAKF